MITREFREADRSFIASLLAPLDLHLRRRQAIYDFSPNPNCIFRLQVVRLDQTFILSDGTNFESGQRVLDLHLWNEHVPHLPYHSLRWALRMSECLSISLRELAHYLARQADLADVMVIRANMSFGTPEQTAQLMRIAARYGFESVPAPGLRTLSEHLHRFGENILISLIVLARNKAALRPDIFRRDRVQVFLSRNILLQRYGCDSSYRNSKPSVQRSCVL